MPPLTVYCVSDGKPGHLSQMQGLINALQRRRVVQLVWIEVSATLTSRLRRRSPPPDLILAAGHRTHLTALLLKWRFGGKVVVMMRPSLPLSWFDACLIPRHDSPPARSNILMTEGALNPLQAVEVFAENQGLILLGGPSSHYQWDNAAMLAQLRQLQQQLPQVNWTLTTSRRTPETMLNTLLAMHLPGFTVVPYSDTDRQWLQQQYQRCGLIWVTEDSVSMVYESLSVGAAVGILSVKRRQASRVSKGIDYLLSQQRLIDLTWLQENGTMQSAAHSPLQEADRAADWIMSRLLSSASSN